MKRCHRYAAEFLQRRVSAKTQQKHKDATFRNKDRDVNLNSTVLGGKSSKCMHNFKKITRRFPKWCVGEVPSSEVSAVLSRFSAEKGVENIILT